jgi:hypothetical protein
MGKESPIPVPEGLIEDSIDHAVDIIAETFKDDPFQRYAVIDQLEEMGKTDITYEHNRSIFATVIPGMLESGARSITIEGSGISSVWYVFDLFIILHVLLIFEVHVSFPLFHSIVFFLSFFIFQTLQHEALRKPRSYKRKRE